jgi:signal transduction histidine kinase
VALIPSIALIFLWLAAALYLGGTGFYGQQVASAVRQVSIPAVAGLSSVEKERQLSMAYLSAHSVDLQPLLAQQKLSDQGLTTMQTAAQPALANAPESVLSRMSTLTGYLGQLPNIRGRIDAGVATTAEVSTFYNNLLDAASNLFNVQARISPDAATLPGALAAANVFHASDLMSRAGSLIAGALASGKLDQATYLQFTSTVGAYHALLDTTVSDLQPDAQVAYQNLISGPQWQGLVNAENAISLSGTWTDGVPKGLQLTSTSWDTMTAAVSTALTDLTVTQADDISQQTLDDSNNQLLGLGIALVVALLVVIGSIWWARRQSTILVDSALVTRLAKLRQDAADLVTVRLPAMVDQLKAGEIIDADQQFPELNYGEGDEIDQVATAISEALRQAVTAAAGEAQARSALNTVFRGIARRNQLPLYNMLRQLDTLEQTEQDSTALERLYKLDHEATRARRNSENLIILSGGDLGSHLPGPVRMLDVLRSAMSETHEYQRVKLKGVVPAVSIAAEAATGLIHLIAELLENASRFSPPSYEVSVRSMPAQAGVIVEVEDRGLGIPHERRDRVNATLAEPPEVDVMAIGDGSQLGFWVIASLIKRYGFKVALRESDYGGILAIVRIPNQLVVTESDSDTPSDALVGVTEHRAPRHMADDDATIVIPRISVAAAAATGDGAMINRSSSRMWFVDPKESTQPEEARAWPSAQLDESRPERSPLPQRSPGDHLNPRLSEESQASEENDEDGTGTNAQDVGAALSAFQRGSEAGRAAGES